jgi:hypothetical protein
MSDFLTTCAELLLILGVCAVVVFLIIVMVDNYLPMIWRITAGITLFLGLAVAITAVEDQQTCVRTSEKQVFCGKEVSQ